MTIALAELVARVAACNSAVAQATSDERSAAKARYAALQASSYAETDKTRVAYTIWRATLDHLQDAVGDASAARDALVAAHVATLARTPLHEDATLADTLAALGYTNRASDAVSSRDIMLHGVVVRTCGAGDAWSWLRDTNHIAAPTARTGEHLAAIGGAP